MLVRQLRKGSKDTYTELDTTKQENSFRETPLCKRILFLSNVIDRSKRFVIGDKYTVD